jgi:uncharacterized membrane protein
MSKLNKTKNILSVLFVFFFFFLTSFNFASAQAIHNDLQGEWKAKVLEVVFEEEQIIPGTEVLTWYQELRVELLEGYKEGQEVIVKNDFHRLKKGDKFYVNYLITVNGEEFYVAGEPYRINVLIFFTLLFFATILIFGKKDGIRSIVSLIGSFLVLIFLMLPFLLKGYPPVPTIVVFSALMLASAMYITHGWNRVTHSAFLGTVITIVVVSILAKIGVEIGKLSGFASDEALYLNINSGGTLDLSGILLGSIIIGALGILDDIAITQAAAVRELFHLAPNESRKEIYTKALRIGKEHVGALVNTLALAYAGASLPLLLLFSQSEISTITIMNREIFATEVIRTVAGSIGLILAVPLSTLFAVMLLKSEKDGEGDGVQHGHAHFHRH